LNNDLTIIVDTREQKNKHVIDFFDKKKIPYKVKKLDEGDYGIKINKNLEHGIYHDMYFPVGVERKTG
jgi:hypothetical protein